MKYEIIYRAEHAAVMKVRRSKNQLCKFRVVSYSTNFLSFYPLYETNDQLVACEYARLTK